MRFAPALTLTATAVALLLAPATLPAQFGKLVKKAKEAAGVEKPAQVAAAAETAQPSRSWSIDPVYQLTTENLDRFTTALVAERAARQETLKLIAGLKSKNAYALCQQSAATSAPYQKLFNQYVEDAPKATTIEASQAVTRKFTDDALAMMLKTCGADPAEYPEHQRESIVRSKGFDAGIEKSGLERRNYAVLKERIIPFCTADAATRAAADVRVPGQGRNIFFVYLPAETATLAPRCDAIMSALQAVS